MAKTMNGDIVVVTGHNGGKYDGAALMADIAELARICAEHREAGKSIKEFCNMLKHDKGYNLRAVGWLLALIRIYGEAPAEAQDIYRTFITGAQEMGLDQPDLVDLAEAKKETTA